ncbi:MAG TPA: ABC transporter permease [Thermodesulfovibrionia bacterium]|nr:ABC transporter permease [Thermodesulfovibrionia bacterium]
MRNLYAIFKRELWSYFHSPILYIFLVFFLILNAVFTFKIGGFYEAGQADLGRFFLWHPWLYLFFIPAVSMRLWSEERKTGTIELLFTLPVGMFEAMSGKFLAAWVFTSLAICLTFPMIFTVLYLGQPDIGVIISSYIGSILLAGSYLAVGCFFSATTKNQVISFIITFATCLGLVLIGFGPFVEFFQSINLPQSILEQVGRFSFLTHFMDIMKGILDLRDLLFFILVIAAFLYAGALVLDNRKAT